MGNIDIATSSRPRYSYTDSENCKVISLQKPMKKEALSWLVSPPTTHTVFNLFADTF